MRSSYIENSYGIIFRSLILNLDPSLVVECGVLDGYSTFHFADAIKLNKISGGVDCDFYAYDLWDGYKYKHGDYDAVKNMLVEKELDNYVELKKGNAFEVFHEFEDKSIDLLHMDISNTGDTLIRTLRFWGDKLSDSGMIAFEGGTEERDNVEWMIKYNFKPIRDVLFNENFVPKNWNVEVLNSFPGLTLLWKK